MPSSATEPDRLDVVVDGRRHHVTCWTPPGATGPPVLALHGFGLTGHRAFRHAAPAFVARGLPLVAPDLLGFGASDRLDGAYSLRRYADALAGLADALALDRPVLLGHSFGGKLAAAAAALHPDRFRGLVLVNSGGFSRYTAVARLFADVPVLYRLLRPRWVRRRLIPRTPLGAVLTGTDAYDQLEDVRPDRSALDLRAAGLHPSLRALHLPTLVVWGTADPLLPRSTVDRIRRLLPAAQVVWLDGAGHAPMKDTPDALADAVAAWAAPLDP